MARVTGTNFHLFEAVWRHPIPINERLLLFALLTKADSNGVVTILAKDLATMLGVDVKAVYAIGQRLREAGWMTSERPREGRGVPSVYRINVKRLRGEQS